MEKVVDIRTYRGDKNLREPRTLLEMTVEIVAAQARVRSMGHEEIINSICAINGALVSLNAGAVGTEADRVPIDVLSSIQQHQVVCLECSKSFKLLSNRHLALHGLTPRTYKRKHGIPMAQPLSARTLSSRRSKVAKASGMGKQLAEWRARRKAERATE